MKHGDAMLGEPGHSADLLRKSLPWLTRETSDYVKTQKLGPLRKESPLSKGDKVALIGFGSFQVTDRKEKRGVNPQTRKTIKTPASKVPKFRSGKGPKK